jgi:hypothetical protein
VPQIVANGGQFRSMFKRMRRVGVSHPMWTGAPQLPCERRMVYRNLVSRQSKETLQNRPQTRASDC